MLDITRIPWQKKWRMSNSSSLRPFWTFFRITSGSPPARSTLETNQINERFKMAHCAYTICSRCILAPWRRGCEELDGDATRGADIYTVIRCTKVTSNTQQSPDRSRSLSLRVGIADSGVVFHCHRVCWGYHKKEDQSSLLVGSKRN